MDTYDFYISEQKAKTKTSYLAIGVFLFVIVLLIILFFLGKYILDKEDKKKNKRSVKFDLNNIIPDSDFSFPKRASSEED